MLFTQFKHTLNIFSLILSNLVNITSLPNLTSFNSKYFTIKTYETTNCKIKKSLADDKEVFNHLPSN